MHAHPDPTRTIRTQLLSDMRDGIYASVSRLPRESALAEKLGISRTQLRDILASLEREGFITRRHGVGTIINRHVLEAQTRMDIEVEFLDMIRQSGYTPAVAYVRASGGWADDHAARQLRLTEGDPVLRVARLCTADGRPAIYCEDIIPRALIREDFTLEDLRSPSSTFCRVLRRQPYLDLTDLRPVTADDALSEVFSPGIAAVVYGRGGLRHRRPPRLLFPGVFRRRLFPPHCDAEKALTAGTTMQHEEETA